jgi:TRAP-type C4-dicarboxylate transport system permease small subunit
LEAFTAAVRRIEHWSHGLGVALLTVVMIVVVADVALRYALNSPIFWAYDVISLYLMAGLFYFVLSTAYDSNSLVNIDMLYEKMSPRSQALSRFATCATSLLLFSLITYAGFARTLEEFTEQAVVAGVIPWPTWPSSAVVTIGSALLVARLGIGLAEALRQLLGAQPVSQTGTDHQTASMPKFEQVTRS